MIFVKKKCVDIRAWLREREGTLFCVDIFLKKISNSFDFPNTYLWNAVFC